MATFELIIILVLAVLISSILDQVIPKISSTLIQIGLGVIIALLSLSHITIDIDPELFLVLFIAPLLFLDAMESDKNNLWQNKGVIVAFAVGLVVLITLCVGFMLHWLVPSIPLAAAFALGAALGPTDAVAVASLKREANLGKRESSILQGEALINDASGVVSFQFAIAAAVTGAFSLANATTTFAISFVGGIVLGIITAFIFRFISGKIYDLGLDNVTFHVLFELSMPFVVFLLSETIGVSGILAVVACGIVWSLYTKRRLSPYQSRLNIANSSVWKVLSFTLNGIVFVLLGMQLPMAMQSTWDDVYISNLFLCALVLILTVLIVGLRFLFSLAMIIITRDPDTQMLGTFDKKTVKQALVTTIGGPKGAITLSIIFSIPFMLSDGTMFPQRSLIIFLASGVILCTLLLANFFLPILAPHTSEGEQQESAAFSIARIDILHGVIERLFAMENTENSAAIKMVMAHYNERIHQIRERMDLYAPSSDELRVQVIDYQARAVIRGVKADELDSTAAFLFMRRLMQRRARLSGLVKKDFIQRLSAWVQGIRMMLAASKHRWQALVARDDDNEEETVPFRQVRIVAEEAAIAYLRSLFNKSAYPTEKVTRLLMGHERTLEMLEGEGFPSLMNDRLNQKRIDTIQREALRIEQDLVRDFYADGRLTRMQSKHLMDNIALMLIDVEDHI